METGSERNLRHFYYGMSMEERRQYLTESIKELSRQISLETNPKRLDGLLVMLKGKQKDLDNLGP